MTFRLSESSVRPVLILDDLFEGCEALLDTGAAIPVWTGDLEMLLLLGAVSMDKQVEFAGFGGKTKGDLYRINLKLGDLIFPDMPILYHRDDLIPGYFLLPGTMFSRIVLNINIHNKFIEMNAIDNQTCFNLVLKDSAGHPYVLCQP